MSDFSGKVALVAGGTGGLGHAVTAAFLAAGAEVTVTFQKHSELEALRSSLGENAARLDAYSVNVADETAVTTMVNAILAKHNRIDALVNAIGGYEAGKKLWEMDAKSMDNMLAINLFPSHVLARVVAPLMVKAGSGSIVSIAATAAQDHPGGSAAYAASKAAVLAMIDSLAADLKGTGVRANSILPSIFDTEANRRAMPSADFSKWAKPEEIARVILFLCSNEAKLVNGAAVRV
jgi:NAD(P)-dependent dehydrogenase (short-subunit alcohol dehydrogenase family)